MSSTCCTLHKGTSEGEERPISSPSFVVTQFLTPATLIAFSCSCYLCYKKKERHCHGVPSWGLVFHQPFDKCYGKQYPGYRLCQHGKNGFLHKVSPPFGRVSLTLSGRCPCIIAMYFSLLINHSSARISTAPKRCSRSGALAAAPKYILLSK